MNRPVTSTSPERSKAGARREVRAPGKLRLPGAGAIAAGLALAAYPFVVASFTHHPVALRLVPSLTSLWLMWVFGSTLRRGPSMVLQFASAMHDGFPEFLHPYCRSVTRVWCLFFAANAATGAVLAVAASPEAWAYYTGVVAYVLIAALGVGEYVFHKSRFRFYENGWADRQWRRFLPPERTALGRRTLEWQRAKSASSMCKGAPAGDLP